METRWIPPAPAHEEIDTTTSAIGTSVVADLHSEIVVSDPLEQYNATPFTPKTYAPSKDVVKLHGFTRFGHTNNVETLITGLSDNDSELTTNYILGVTSGAMLVFAIAAVWFMIIIGFKVAGPKKVGFLAGKLEHPEYDATAPVRNVGALTLIENDPPEASSDGETETRSLLESDFASPLIITNTIDADSDGARADKKFKKKVIAVRMTFVLSGLAMIVCGSLFYGIGMMSFRRSLDNTSQGLQLIHDTAYQAKTVLENVKLNTDQLILDYNNTKTRIGGEFCKGDRDYAKKIREQTDVVEEKILAYKGPVDENVDQAVHDLDHIILVANKVDNHIDTADVVVGITIALSIVIGVLIFAMLIVTFFSWKEVSNQCTKLTTYAMLWPVFNFLLILFFIFALLFLVTALASADVCYDPDTLMVWFLHKIEEKADDKLKLLFEFAIYYVSGCQNQPRIVAIDEINDLLLRVNGMTDSLRKMPVVALQLMCGFNKSEATDLREGLELLYNATDFLNKDLIDAQVLMECRTFNPIYTTLMYDAVCMDGVDGLSWIFSTSLLLVVFAMFLIMFRAALYPVKTPPRSCDQGLGRPMLS